jgi:hypothetical protein
MVQLILSLAIVAALVYFVLFRTGSQTEDEPAKPYAAEVQKSEQVEQVLQQGREQRLFEEMRQEPAPQQQSTDE